MSEISHRSKNLLAVVQAIAAQTARTKQLPSSRLRRRISVRCLKSLASSVDLLVQQEWRGVFNNKSLVHSQLGHYGDTSDRVETRDPNFLANATGRAVPRHGAA